MLISSDWTTERGPKAEVSGTERLQTEVHADPEDQGQTRETGLRPRVNFPYIIFNIKIYCLVVFKFEYKYFVILIVHLQNAIKDLMSDHAANLRILL